MARRKGHGPRGVADRRLKHADLPSRAKGGAGWISTDKRACGNLRPESRIVGYTEVIRMSGLRTNSCRFVLESSLLFNRKLDSRSRAAMKHPPLPAVNVLPNELTESALPPSQAEPTNDYRRSACQRREIANSLKTGGGQKGLSSQRS
jgi:hypothetical protein